MRQTSDRTAIPRPEDCCHDEGGGSLTKHLPYRARIERQIVARGSDRSGLPTY